MSSRYFRKQSHRYEWPPPCEYEMLMYYTYYYCTTVQSNHVCMRVVIKYVLQNLVVPINSFMYVCTVCIYVCISNKSVESRPVSLRVSSAACIHPDPYPLGCLCPGDTVDTSPMSWWSCPRCRGGKTHRTRCPLVRPRLECCC